MEPENSVKENLHDPQNNKEKPPSKSIKSKLKKNKRFFVAGLLLIVILVFLGLISTFLYLNKSSDQESVKPEIVQKTPTPEPTRLVPTYIPIDTKSVDLDLSNKVLNDLQTIIGTKSTLREFKYNRWKLTSNNELFTKGYSFSLAEDSYESASDFFVDTYKTIPKSKDSRGNIVYDADVILSTIYELEEISDSYFIGIGLKLNTQNSSESSNLGVKTEDGYINNGIEIAKAYEKDGVYCISKFDQRIFTYANFSCAIKDVEQTNLQNTIGEELKSLYNPTNSPNVKITIYSWHNDTATGSVQGNEYSPETPAGGFTAKKVDGKWTHISWTKQN